MEVEHVIPPTSVAPESPVEFGSGRYFDVINRLDQSDLVDQLIERLEESGWLRRPLNEVMVSTQARAMADAAFNGQGAECIAHALGPTLNHRLDALFSVGLIPGLRIYSFFGVPTLEATNHEEFEQRLPLFLSRINNE